MKKEKVNKKTKQGFTLIEMLVVVLIIGILAAVALPQYKVSVMKTEITGLLPVMRAWKDALVVYKMAQGEYPSYPTPSPVDLGVFTTELWDEFNAHFSPKYIHCYQEDREGTVFCSSNYGEDLFQIRMYQADYPYSEYKGMTICTGLGSFHKKVCKALCSEVFLEDTDVVVCRIG